MIKIKQNHFKCQLYNFYINEWMWVRVDWVKTILITGETTCFLIDERFFPPDSEVQQKTRNTMKSLYFVHNYMYTINSQ